MISTIVLILAVEVTLSLPALCLDLPQQRVEAGLAFHPPEEAGVAPPLGGRHAVQLSSAQRLLRILNNFLMLRDQSGVK